VAFSQIPKGQRTGPMGAADGRGGTRKTMIVALARKLLITLWRLVTTGEISDDIVIRPAS
jgi:transposase